jgi:hypothetical protein
MRGNREVASQIVARGDGGRGAFILLQRIELKQEVGARQLAIHVLCVRGCAGVQRPFHPLAFRAADLPKPPVLEARKQRDEPEQRARDHRHRHSELPSHAAILASDPRSSSWPDAGFTCLTNS